MATKTCLTVDQSCVLRAIARHIAGAPGFAGSETAVGRIAGDWGLAIEAGAGEYTVRPFHQVVDLSEFNLAGLV